MRKCIGWWNIDRSPRTGAALPPGSMLSMASHSKTVIARAINIREKLIIPRSHAYLTHRCRPGIVKRSLTQVHYYNGLQLTDFGNRTDAGEMTPTMFTFRKNRRRSPDARTIVELEAVSHPVKRASRIGLSSENSQTKRQ